MKHFKINNLFILIVLTLPVELFASYRFEHFSNKEGFNQNTINDIEQDKYGFLWFATPNGLIKYDGYDFITYTNNPGNLNSISNNTIQRLAKDQYGNLWIGTFEGVNVYIPQYEKFLTVPFAKDILVSGISIDTKGNVWISGNNEFYICRLEKTGTNFSFKISDNLLKNVPDISTIVDFCFINENNILVAHADGLTQLEFMDISYNKNHNLKSFHHFKKFENYIINTIHKNGSLFWIGTNNGIFKTLLDGNTIQIVDKIRLTTSDNRNISDFEVLSIFNDNNGSIWIGSASEGIFKINEKNGDFEHFGFNNKDETGITSSRINCFYQDTFGVIWIGTAQGGVNKLDLNQKPFYTYSNNPYDEESIGGNLIMDIIEDEKGKIWVPSYDGTLSRSINPVKSENIEQLKFEQLKDQLPLEKDDHINTIFEDDKGFIWMGTETSIIVFNPFEKSYKKIDLMRDGKSFSFYSVRVIRQEGLNAMLFGGGDGIFMVMDPWAGLKNKNPGFELIPIFNKGGIVNCLEKTNTNHYWIGTERGLFLCTFESNSFEIIRQFHKDGGDFKLSSSNVFSIHIGIEGNIWIGTFGGGLNKVTLDKKGLPIKIDYYRKDGILPDDAVYGILQENKECLWFSTDMGLCRLNIISNEIDIFDVRDGIANNNFRMRAYYKNDNGVFYFGGLNGLTMFDPSKIQSNKGYSIPLVTGISVNNVRINIGEKVNGKVLLQKPPIELNNIIVNHKAKTLTFHILAQQYSIPFKNQLAYFLEGFNNDWIFSEDGKTSVTYTNLPKGNYILHVKSANGDGIWNENAMNLNITVLPPWYNTWWSYLIFSIIVISIVVGIFIYFIRLEKLQQHLKFEQIDKKRIDKLNQGKLEFFTNISHEFRTPLTLISGPLEIVIEKTMDIENSKYLKIIQNNTKRLLNLIDQLMTFRKAEQGGLNFYYSSDTLGRFIFPTTEAFEQYAIKKDINFFYKINSPNEEVIIDVEKLERIVFNLLENSFRHTPVNGNVSIECDILWKNNEKIVSLSVIDSGSGIPKEEQSKIFERFYQLDYNRQNKGGTGIGLAYCKSLIDLMGGDITVDSEPGKKTCFTVLIPSKPILEFDEEKQDKSWKSFVKDWLPGDISNINLDESRKKEKHKFSILIVDDDADVRDFLFNDLQVIYSIVLAENGDDGFNKTMEKEPDLIISDVLMEGMNGFEFCEKIKSNPETCHIPVILLTALGDFDNTLKGLEFGADDYIGKPFSPKHLKIRIQKLIDNNRKIKEHFSKNSNIPDLSIKMSKREKEFLKQVISAIEENISNSNFGVEELAREIGLSSSQFYRRLKQLTGQVPNVYLRNFRLQRAASLLNSNEGFNVAEVMYQIGIESSSYFSTSFKKLYGVSPSEFIK